MSGTESIPSEATGSFSGIINKDSPNSGNQGAGSQNINIQRTVQAPGARPDAVTTADLIAAIRAVQVSLHQHCAGGVVSKQVADEALAALDKAAVEASKPKAEARAAVSYWLSRANTTLSGVASVASTLANSIAALESVFRQLFGG